MTSVLAQSFLILISLFLVLPVAEAVEVGDEITLLLGVILSITQALVLLRGYVHEREMDGCD